MVRAAASGVIDYTKADPKDRKWRIRHLLLLTELERREDYELLVRAHAHWLALLSHGRLTEDSFTDVKMRANDLLQDVQHAVFPWAVQESDADPTAKKDTIDPSAQELIERYKERYGK